MRKSAESGMSRPASRAEADRRPSRRRRRGSAGPSRRRDRRTEEGGDARLVERARGGDDRAFAALVARYERKLIRVLARLVHDEELARDLAQETFWKVYNRLDRFDTSRRFGPWLFRIGVNLGLDQLRRHEAPPAASIDRSAGDGRGRSSCPTPTRGSRPSWPRRCSSSWRGSRSPTGRSWCSGTWKGSPRRRWRPSSAAARPRCGGGWPRPATCSANTGSAGRT